MPLPRDRLWWTSFGDSLLSRAIETALRRHPSLEKAAAAVDAAIAQARIAGADLWPQLSGGVSGSRQRRNFIGFPIPGAEERVLTTIFNTFGTSLDLSWELDLWGRVRSGRAAALADVEAAEALRQGAILSLAGQTAKAWFAAVEADAQVALAARTVELYRETLETVRERYARGLVASLDLRLAESNLASAQALLESRRAQRDAALRQLEILQGRYPRAELGLPDSLPPVPPPLPAGVPAHLLARRPDLVAAERRVAAAGARWEASRAALYPRLSLTGSRGRVSSELSDLLDGNFTVWSLAGNILQPLFQGGRLRAGVALSEARLREAAAAFAETLLQALAEVETSLRADSLLAAQEVRLREAARQAEASRRLAREQYAQGLADILVVLESQRRALEARSQLLAVRRQRLTNRVNLYLALGGTVPEEILGRRETHREEMADS
jgi:NodT family efflux transporter outer membrane factor (OMF) lipoprotein